ncbi:unnamed protein product [Cercospora beticola]|nr:unnamed protein product [Cercospora beticola]
MPRMPRSAVGIEPSQGELLTLRAEAQILPKTARHDYLPCHHLPRRLGTITPPLVLSLRLRAQSQTTQSRGRPGNRRTAVAVARRNLPCFDAREWCAKLVLCVQDGRPPVHFISWPVFCSPDRSTSGRNVYEALPYHALGHYMLPCSLITRLDSQL